MSIQRDIFPKRTSVNSVSPQWAMPVINQSASIKTTDTFTAGTDFTISAGAAGTQVKILLPIAPILGNFGRTGSFGNSSFAFGGAAATTFTTEVAFVADSSSRGGDASGLSNGQYMVDYEAAVVYAKKADSGTTGTCTYTFLESIGGGGGGGDVVGPASSTTNAVALFADTTGKLLQNSVVLINPATGVSTGFSTITLNAAGQFIATTGAAPSAGVDLVKVSAVDYASGDARLNIQGETGGAIRIGNSTVSLGTNGIVESNTGTLTLSAATGLLGTVAGNTAAAFKIFDGGGEKYYNIDTRLTTAGVSAHEWQVNTSGFAIASGAGNLARQGLFATYNLAYTGTTQVTSLVDSIKLEGPTISSDTPTLTVDKTTGLSLKAPIQGSNVTLSNNSALRIINGGAGAANYGIYIEDQTGGTTDFGLAIGGADTAALWVSSDADTTDAANGIAFGLSRDTTLYRSAAGVLSINGVPILTSAPGFAGYKTIGSGGDYADVQAMIADSQYKGILISNVTENSDIVPDANGLYLDFNGFTLTLGTFRIDPSAACTITLQGNGPISELDYTYSSSVAVIDSTTSSYTVILRDLTIDNNSSVEDTKITNGAEVLYMRNVWFEIPNVSTTATTPLGVQVDNARSYGTNLTFTGGGAAADVALLSSVTARFTNILFRGTWAASATAPQIRAAAGTFINITNVSSVAYEIGGIIDGVDAQAALALGAFQDYATFSNIRSFNSGSNVAFDGEGRDFLNITNCIFNTFDGTDASFNDCKMSNVLIAGNVTLAGDRHQWSNITITGTLTVSAGSDFHNMIGMNCNGNVSWTGDQGRFDGILGTGITFTLESTATNNNLDVTIDQAVTDSSGVGTNAIAQLIY